MELLFESLAYHGTFEAQLPNDEQDMVQKLQTNTPAESGICYASNAASPAIP